MTMSGHGKNEAGKLPPDSEWLRELSPEERAALADPSDVDVDPEAVLRWLETGEGDDPWPRGE
jgi:hypothetical protein